jgi:TM2 domain-containing membrane protein YozV
MTTPPAQPPGSDPSGWPQHNPPGGWPAPGQSQFPPPPGEYPPTASYPGYADPYANPYAAQSGYPAAYPSGYYPDASAPYGYDQHGRPYSEKQKLIAGLLQILIGGLGIGRFYTGHVGIGIAQIAVTLVTCGIGAIWGLIDGILILVNGGTDAEGRPLREN